MRYEDSSQAGPSTTDNLTARDDADALAAGDRSPATGNVINGAETLSGALGADLGADGARVVSISGAQGSDSSPVGGKLAVGGEFGRLTIDAGGNYRYFADKDAPENSRDVFTYKLAGAGRQSDEATLTIEIGKSPAVVRANAEQVIVGPDGVVVLPAGVDLSDVRVSGRNLVIDLPDGTQMLIVDGAVFVPRLVLGDVEVPATNLAALLIDSEIRPAAGIPQSGGGNFEVPVRPLDPGVVLGDLIPPTELATSLPDFREAAFDLDREPSILIQTPDQPAGVADATASVNEDALPARGAEPAGSNSASTAEATTGTIIFEAADTPSVVAINGTAITAVGQAIAGLYGILTITSITGQAIGYRYTLGDNTVGDATEELYSVSITDRDGDVDLATLRISVIDDVPVARPDSATQGAENAVVLVNVMANDTTGADGVNLATGVTLVAGSLSGTGALAYNNNGTFTYTPGVGEQGTVVFQYRIIDGDGDPSVASVTITLAADSVPVTTNVIARLDDDGLPTGNPIGDSTNGDDDQNAAETGSGTSSEAVWTGSVSATSVDGPVTYSLAGMVAVSGQTVGTETVAYSYSVNTATNVGTLTAVTSGGTRPGTTLFTVALDQSTGAFTLTLVNPIMHDSLNGLTGDNLENNTGVVLTYTASDADVSPDVSTGTISIDFDDDTPAVVAVTTPLAIANSGTVSGTGTFDFNIGADVNSDGDDIVSVVFNATVNGVAVTAKSITAVSETTTTATFNFTFTYPTGPGISTTNSGTLVFDKTAGTYTVDLASPIAAFSISSTSQGTLFQGYVLNSTATDNSQPDVSVTRIRTDDPATTINEGLFVQFTAIAEPGSGTGSNNLFTANYNLDGSPASDGQPNTFTAGELFAQASSWVSTSNADNGVGGDTIQGGEVLDFNLYNTNPFGFINTTPTASAESIFFKIDGVGTSEDFIVILKLFNPTTGEYTTKAVMVENGDIIKGSTTVTQGPGQYSSILLDNNDGLVIIEANDYNMPGFVIVGAQIAGSDEGVIGTAIDLNGATGTAGASTGTQAFSTDTSNQPFKISDIGFATSSSTVQQATLTFDVTVEDADGDAISQSLVVNVGGTSSPVVLDTNHDGSIGFLGLDAGVAYDYDGDGVKEATAWVAPGDSILVRDSDGNGKVTDASEFVFGGNGRTDLEALHAQYGAQLDAADADFAMFMVWNDANSNGIADGDELQSLTQSGIVSINLVSNGIASTAAGGDVAIAGEGQYSFVNDNGVTSTGLLADATFRIATRTGDAAQRTGLAPTGSTVMSGAVAAMGLAATQGAATGHESAPGGSGLASPSRSATGQEALTDASETIGANPALLGFAPNVAIAGPASNGLANGPASPVKAALDTPANDDATSISLVASTETPAHDTIATSLVAPMIVMPSAESLAIPGESGTQRAIAVEKVLAETLEGGANGADIDTLLARLPNHGSNDNPGLGQLTSPGGEGVSPWDTGTAGGLPDIHVIVTAADMILFHHDSVQPAING